jgi:hypothetical protein
MSRWIDRSMNSRKPYRSIHSLAMQLQLLNPDKSRRYHTLSDLLLLNTNNVIFMIAGVQSFLSS